MRMPDMPVMPKTIAIYICNDLYDTMQIRKVQELQSYFGKDLIVVTDQKDIRDDWILPAEQVVSPHSNISLTKTSALSGYVCCGIERTIMWLVQNQDYYDFAWFIEDDVLWSNFTDLKDFFQSYIHDDTDLLHSNPEMEECLVYGLRDKWPWYKLLLPPYVTTQAMFFPPFHRGIFQFFRISSRFVAAVNDWRLNKNKGEWTYMEPLFANFAFRKDAATTNLTTKNFINNSIGYDMQIRWRPCFSLEQVYNKTSSKNGGRRGGLFHPVKKDAFSEDCRQLEPEYLCSKQPPVGIPPAIHRQEAVITQKIRYSFVGKQP